MGRNRFQKPDVKRLELSDGDWITIKKELNNGDQKRCDAAGMKKPMLANGRVISPIDWEVYAMERCLVYLVEWSFEDETGARVAVTLDALKAMDTESFDEIDNAIAKFVREHDEAKKQQRIAKMTDTPTQFAPESETTSS